MIAVSGDKFVDQAARDYIKVGQTGVSTYQTIDIDAPVEPPDLSRVDRGPAKIVDELVIDKPRGTAHEAGPRSVAGRPAPQPR